MLHVRLGDLYSKQQAKRRTYFFDVEISVSRILLLGKGLIWRALYKAPSSVKVDKPGSASRKMLFSA